MIRVYLLPVVTIDGTQHVAGEEFIHNALLECTANPLERQLTQDTTQADHDGLVSVALSYRDATPEENDRWHELVPVITPDPNVEALKLLLKTNPHNLTIAIIWEAIFRLGKYHGFTT